MDTVALGRVVDPGPYSLRTVGMADPAGDLFGVLDLLTEILQLASTGRTLQFSLPLQVPGLLSAKVQIAIGEPPANASSFAIGPVGTTVYTAQTRILLDLDLLGISPLASVRLPIYLELASAQAELAELTCSGTASDSDELRLKVTPGVADAWIGEVRAAELSDQTKRPSPGTATLVDIPLLLRIKGQAHAAIRDLAPRTLTFTRAEIERSTRKTTSTTDLAGALVRSVLGDLRLRVELLGLGVPLGVDRLVVDILAARLGVVDQVLSHLLGVLGVKIGVADAWATSLRCSSAVLVR